MFNYLLLLVLSSVTCSIEKSDISLSIKENIALDDDEYILCRGCGSDITAADYLISLRSPSSHYAFNDTVFNKRVLIQMLSNGIFLDFPVITATHSNCVAVGEWEDQNSWFPGYRWQICVCPDCGEFVGWLYDPISPVKSPARPFFGLILPNLIGESYIDSVIKLLAVNS